MKKEDFDRLMYLDLMQKSFLLKEVCNDLGKGTVTKYYLSEDTKVGFLLISPGGSIDMHGHEEHECELWLLISGEVRINGEKIEEGEGRVCEAEKQHELQNLSTTRDAILLFTKWKQEGTT